MGDQGQAVKNSDDLQHLTCTTTQDEDCMEGATPDEDNDCHQAHFDTDEDTEFQVPIATKPSKCDKGVIWKTQVCKNEHFERLTWWSNLTPKAMSTGRSIGVTHCRWNRDLKEDPNALQQGVHGSDEDDSTND